MTTVLEVCLWTFSRSPGGPPQGKLRLPAFPGALLVYSNVHASETVYWKRVNSPLQTCSRHFGKTIFVNATLSRKRGPLQPGPRNQIKTFKHVVCFYIYKITVPYNENQTTNQTKINLKVYTCFLTSQQIRNCIGYTLCKAKSLLSVWNITPKLAHSSACIRYHQICVLSSLL